MSPPSDNQGQSEVLALPSSEQDQEERPAMSDIQRTGDLDELHALFDRQESSSRQPTPQPAATLPTEDRSTMHGGRSDIPIPQNRILAGTHPAQIAQAAGRPDDQH